MNFIYLLINSPDASRHVCGVIEKMYSRLWTLRFLKKSGMGKDELLKVYKTIIRPGAEYSLSLIRI